MHGFEYDFNVEDNWQEYLKVSGGGECPDLASCIDMEGVEKLYDMMGIFGG